MYLYQTSWNFDELSCPCSSPLNLIILIHHCWHSITKFRTRLWKLGRSAISIVLESESTTDWHTDGPEKNITYRLSQKKTEFCKNLICSLLPLTSPQSVTSRSREFPFPGILHFLWWYRNRNPKNLIPKKVLEPVSKKFGTEKKSWNRSRKNLVPKKSIGIGIVQI